MLNYPFRRSCKEVATLVVAREDRALGLSETMALRVHMLICKACPGFEQQMLTMRSALRQWRNYTGDPEAAALEQPAELPADKAAK